MNDAEFLFFFTHVVPVEFPVLLVLCCRAFGEGGRVVAVVVVVVVVVAASG